MSVALRARIQAAAERLGYVPNFAARALTTRQSRLVGVIASTLADPITPAILVGVESRLRKADYQVALAIAGRTGDETAVHVRGLLAMGVDALLSWDIGTTAPQAEQAAAAHGVPWLALDRDGAAIGRVSGATLACRYLLSLGHERFGAVAPACGSVEAAIRDALAGTRARCLAAKTSEEPDGGPGEAHAVIAHLLDQVDPPSAIVCASDLEAAAVLRECRGRGFAVPRQVSVVGFGDTEVAKHAWPSLTTVRVSTEELATRAADALLAVLRGEVPNATEPAVKLVVRESTATAAR